MSSTDGAKIAFADLLHSTVSAKTALFSVSGRAEDVEHIPEFPALPGLHVSGIDGIDPNASLPLPLTKECGALFFKIGSDDSPRSVVAADTDTTRSSSTNKDVAVVSQDKFRLSNPQWDDAVALLAVHALKEMGIESKNAYQKMVTAHDVSAINPKLLVCRPSASISTDLYQEDNIESRPNTRGTGTKTIFASLLIQLPSELVPSGGIGISHDDVEIVYPLGAESGYNMYNQAKNMAPYACHYLCHYRDCKARSAFDSGEQDGYRTVLAYDLEWNDYSGQTPYPTLPPAVDKDALRTALEKVAPADRLFAISLEHLYYESALSEDGIGALKPQEMAIINVIEQIGGDDNWKFRVVLFNGYIPDIRGRAQRPGEPIWYDEVGDVLRDKSDIPSVNWRISDAGGNVISNDEWYLDSMIRTERYEGEMSAVIVAYDAGSSTEITATRKFEAAISRLRSRSTEENANVIADALDVDGVRPSIPTLMEMFDLLGDVDPEISKPVLMKIFAICTKRKLTNVEIIAKFIHVASAVIGKSFGTLIKTVVTKKGSFSEHFLTFLQQNGPVDAEQERDFFTYSLQSFIESSNVGTAKGFAEWLAQQDVSTQVAVIVSMPTMAAMHNPCQSTLGKLKIVEDEVCAALHDQAMEVVRVLFIKDKKRYKRRNLFDPNRGKVTIDKGSLSRFFFLADQDTLERLTEWSSDASYEDLGNLMQCLPPATFIASVQHPGEASNAMKCIVKKYLEQLRANIVAKPEFSWSMPKAKHSNRKVQAFLRSDAKIGTIPVKNEKSGADLAYSIAGSRPLWCGYKGKDDDVIMKEGFSAVAQVNGRRKTSSVKVQKTDRLYTLESAAYEEWRARLDAAEIELAKLMNEAEREPNAKKRRL